MSDLERVVSYLAGWKALAEGLDLPDIEDIVRPTWHRKAACRGKAELMFPGRGEPTEPAKALCASCPVVDSCYEAGLHEHAGIWAGLSEKQRRAARRTAA